MPASNRTAAVRSTDRPDAGLSYAANVRLSETQRMALLALQEREGIGYSAAIRRAIDEWRQVQEEEPVTQGTFGTVHAIEFVAVPELGDHVEMRITYRHQEGDEVTTHRWEVNLDASIAQDLQDQLATALEALEPEDG